MKKYLIGKTKTIMRLKSDDSITDILEDCGYSHDPEKT